MKTSRSPVQFLEEVEGLKEWMGSGECLYRDLYGIDEEMEIRTRLGFIVGYYELVEAGLRYYD